MLNDREISRIVKGGVLFVLVTSAMLYLYGILWTRPVARRFDHASTARWLCTPTSYPPNVTVLGRVLENCTRTSTSTSTPNGFTKDDIYVTVKTTQNNHNTRLRLILRTWLQTVQPDQVHIVTDKLSADEEFYKVSSTIGFHVTQALCEYSHMRNALCCKSGVEYSEYFNAIASRDPERPYRWYCHFDDDVYVNVPMLVDALQELTRLNSSREDFYFGRWPAEISKLKNGYTVSKEKMSKLGIKKPNAVIKWATGAAYCISSSLMQKMEPYLRRHMYQQYCNQLGINDDVVPAVLAAIEGCTLHNDMRVKTQYNQLGDIPMSELPHQITISYSVIDNNTIVIPEALFSPEEDPSRFLSYHCLLYPSTSWCREQSDKYHSS